MYLIKRLGLTISIAAMLLLAACSGEPEATPEPSPTQTPQQTAAPQETAAPTATAAAETAAPEEGTPPTVTEAATTIMRAIKGNDMQQLSAWVDVEEGVRFSPYASIDKQNDLMFTGEELAALPEDATKLVWRTLVGSDQVIELTFADYYKQYIYDADFFTEGEVSVNKPLGEEANIGNLREIYPAESYDFVDYHIASDGTDDRDWRTLRLVLKKVGSDHSLVGIIHNQWTP
ncbi:hypothetical protein [Paenibacillus donghaensis]|uniref:Lipoprotein n=1 Tax=Paenibacillus donghaensis TaxID=414771 RepID=A0A2Z2KKH1_9BACL|nr:hypothetical protein [Paenibacillus donghaensis]ASA24735.1 hypothetical protein B9T62_30645 [Paenibacillus donghaensis]